MDERVVECVELRLEIGSDAYVSPGLIDTTATRGRPSITPDLDQSPGDQGSI
ncbi:MAG: hypothetical protein M3P87_05425 [Actinomycetota bacterium]|nr:hypothetical protein [Actinomycetota bacterium]